MSLFGNYTGSYLLQSRPSCVHSLCSSCLTQLLTAWKISVDQTKIQRSPQGDLILIDELSKLPIESNVDWSKCKTHGKKLELFCLEHNTSICTDCYIFGECNHHPVKRVTDFKPQVEEKKREIEKIAACLEKANSELSLLIAERQKTLKKRLSEFSLLQKNDLDLKLFELSLELEQLIAHHHRELDSQLGKQSKIANMVSEKLSEYDKFTRANNPLDILKQTNTLLEESVNKSISDFHRVIEEKLQKISDTIEQILESISSLPNIDDCPTLLELSDPIPEFEKQEQDPINLRGIKSASSLKLVSNFDIEVGLRSLHFYHGPFNQKSPFYYNKRDQRTFDTLLFQPKNLNITEADLFVFRYLQKKYQPKRLSFHIKREVENNGTLGKILSSFLWNPSFFEEITFELAIPSDADLYPLFNEILPQMDNLKYFNFRLDGSKVTDKAISVLAQKVLPNLTKLHTFYLNISGTQVQEEAVLDLIHNLPRVQDFLLDFAGLPISDREIRALVERIKDDEKINFMGLTFSETKVTDLGFQLLFDNIPETIQNININLIHTEVTSSCVQNFLKFKVPRLERMNRLMIRTDDEFLNRRIDKWNIERMKEIQKEEELKMLNHNQQREDSKNAGTPTTSLYNNN